MALGLTKSLTFGCRSWKSANNFGNRYVSNVSGALTVSDPVTSPEPAPTSTTASLVCSARASSFPE
jgi:hypothetical protein